MEAPKEYVGKDGITRTYVTPKEPEHKKKIALSIDLPQDKEYLTIWDIIDFAENHYDFLCDRSNSESSESKDSKDEKKPPHSDKYDSVRRRIERYIDEYIKNRPSGMIEDEPPVLINGRNKKYHWKLVKEVFEDVEIQLYFLEISIFKNERKLEKATGDTGALSKRIDNLKHRQELILNSPELRERLMKENSAILDSMASEYSDDFRRICGVEDFKKKILFQFVSESLIDLNEELLASDLGLIPRIEDGGAITDDQLWAIHRLKDLHNYYEERYDPTNVSQQVLMAIKEVVAEVIKESVGEIAAEVAKKVAEQLSKETRQNK